MGKAQCLDTLGRFALVASVAIALPHSAKAEPEHARIDYSAPESCPNTAEFMRSLRERTKRFQEAAVNEEARRLVVRISPSDTRYVGRLEIQGLDGTSALRKVEGKDCTEVAEALSLMTALAIDPDALTRPKSEEDVPPSPPIQPLESKNESTAWHWSTGVLGQAFSGVSPALGYGGAAFVETAAPTPSAPGPALRAAVHYFQSGKEMAEPARTTTHFRWAFASAAGCPYRLAAWDAHVILSPCLALSLGILHGEATGIPQPKQSLSVWSDLSAAFGVRVVMTEKLSLEAQGALIFPITRPQFAILDEATRQSTLLFAVPRVGGSMGIGLSYRFR